MATATLILAGLGLALLLILVLRRPAPPDLSALLAELARQREESARQEERLRGELAAQRREQQETAQALRGELGALVQQLGQTLREPVSALGEAQGRQLTAFAAQLEELRERLSREASNQRGEQGERLTEFGRVQAERLDALRGELSSQLTQMRGGVAEQLDKVRAENADKLEQMRRTVDEKLHETLEKRLGESFRQVSEQLQAVYAGLGEMQGLAAGVGDLKKVLTNVKTRGTWGEVQLGALLEQMLAPEQFVRQYRPRPRSAEVVEFAVRLPGRNAEDGPVFLPIDAKFPKEDYERLVDASERGDAAGVEVAARQLESRLKSDARDIRDKYVHPPATTDFAILFLPTEGLYAEVLRRPGLAEQVQRDFKVMVAGPTTLAALLNSLQLGFRTLAIQKRSSEVWKLLSTVKTKFESFGALLEKAERKIEDAGKELARVRNDTRIMGDKLRKVEVLPEAAAVLPEAAAVLPEAEVEPLPELPLALEVDKDEEAQ
jgi:DNA recombination protein RmuC